MRCWCAGYFLMLRDFCFFNEREWLGLKFQALALKCGCQKLEDLD